MRRFPSTEAPTTAVPGGDQQFGRKHIQVRQLRGPHAHAGRTNPGGEATPVAAAVRVPLAYFAAIYTRANPTIKDPTEKDMRALIDEQLPKIRRDVMACTVLEAGDGCRGGNVYRSDVACRAAPSRRRRRNVAGGARRRSRERSHSRRHGVIEPVYGVDDGQEGRGRSGGCQSIPGGDSGVGGGRSFATAAEDIGEASEGNAALDGMELDDETIRTQQMLDQVSNLVKEDPESAVTMVKRWMNRS